MLTGSPVMRPTSNAAVLAWIAVPSNARGLEGLRMPRRFIPSHEYAQSNSLPQDEARTRTVFNWSSPDEAAWSVAAVVAILFGFCHCVNSLFATIGQRLH